MDDLLDNVTGLVGFFPVPESDESSRRQCPVEGCPGVSETQAAMRVHFMHRHVHDTVVILEDGNPPLPRFPPVRPPGLQEGAQWVPPGDKPMQNGSGKKNPETRSSGGRGSNGEGFQRLQDEVELVEAVPLPREDPHEQGQ